MLIRRYSDPEKTVRTSRHEWPKYWINRQEVMLDAWEEDNCTEAIRYAVGCAITVCNIEPAGWSRIPCGVTSIGQPFIRVAEDPETGYIYYRRPIDLERLERWRHDKTFRVKANEWWDTDELNKWWKEMEETRSGE